MAKSPLLIITLFLCQACGLATTRPKLEMSLAAAAYIAAKNKEAPNLAPALFRRAEEFYIKAKSAYRRKYFNKAKQYAIISQSFSEKAEFKAIKRKTLENIQEF